MTVNGVPVNNASVTLRATGTSDVVAQTLTDPTGFYVLTAESGTYDVVATDGVRSRSFSAFAVPVSRTLDISLASPFVRVSGTFVGPGGLPIENGDVSLSCGNAVNRQATGADGRFSFQAVTGTSNCSVTAFSPTRSRVRQSFEVTTTAEQLDLSADLEVDLQPSTVPFTVTVQNTDGSPAAVAAISTTPVEGVRTTRARYVFGAFDWESTRLGVSSAVLDVVPGPTIVAVELADGSFLRETVDTTTQSSVTLTASTPSILSGRLLTPGGAPATTGTGTVDCNAGTTAFITDANGDFSLPVTPARLCNVALRSFTSDNDVVEQLELFAYQADLSGDLALDLAIPTADLTIDVVDGGVPATDIWRIVVEPESTPVFTTSTGTLYVSRWFIMQFGSPSVVMPTVAGRTKVSVYLNNGQLVQQIVDTSVQTSVTVNLVPPMTLTMNLRTPFDEPASGASVILNCPTSLRFLNSGVSGVLTLPLSPQTGCNIATLAIVERDGHRSDVRLNFGTVDLSSDVNIEAVVPHTDQSIDVVNADGSPAGVTRIDLEPWTPGGQVGTTPPSTAQLFRMTQFGASSTVLPALAGDNRVQVQLASGALIEQLITTPPTGGHATLVLSSPPLWLTGAPGTSNDGDSVSDLTEALAPNNGDGNGDGVPDYEQANVTSYPSSAGSYVTLVAPAGTTLGNVRTVDPATYSLPPQLVLPEGLTDFRVDGVTPGSDVTLTIFTLSAAQVIAYVKYQGGTLKILPFDRFTKFADRVQIRLTDGGPGDDDGVANGVIVDPGGVATSVPVIDDIAPTVTGAVSPAPNAAGWHRGPVTVDWQAVDPAPSSGDAGDPADTVVSTEGAIQSITSAPSCDQAGNCATGTVQVSIDLTAPTVTVTRSAAGEVSCSATDALSGVSGSCTVGTPQQTSPGVFTVSASATDVAGNVGSGSLTYTVSAPSDRSVVQSWITQLTALPLTGRNASARNEALDELRDVAEAGNWTSSGALRASEADDVFEGLAEAATELAKITGTPVPGQVNAAIVSLTRRWAVDAIAAAPGRGVRANRIAQAQQSLNQGDAHRTQGRTVQAIDAYAKAYERVTND